MSLTNKARDIYSICLPSYRHTLHPSPSHHSRCVTVVVDDIEVGDSAETLCLSGLPFKLINTAAFCEGVHSEELKGWDGGQEKEAQSLSHNNTRTHV